MDPVVSVILRAALALLFVVAALHKLREPDAFRATFAAYRLLPEALAGVVARVLPLLELVVAVLLVTPRLVTPGALGAAALLVLYAAAMGVNLLRGRRDLDCGCMGTRSSGRIGGGLLARNAVLIAAALLCLTPVQARSLVWLDGFTVALAVGVLAALYAAAERLLANASGIAALREAMRA